MQDLIGQEEESKQRGSTQAEVSLRGGAVICCELFEQWMMPVSLGLIIHLCAKHVLHT